MFYLKKVIGIIRNPKCRVAMVNMEEMLREHGMQLQCFEPEEFELMEVQGKSSLFVTDVSEIAKALRQRGKAVLALLHGMNREQDFSLVLYACEEPWDMDADYLDKIYRRYMRLPWEILRTDRCILRETVPEDAEAFFEIYGDGSITRYTDALLPEMEAEKQHINDYIDNVYSFYNFGVWTILKKDTDEIIGRAGFSYREGFEEPELGYVIGKAWQRRGYAEEVCSAVLEYGWEELEFGAVQAFVHPENKASLALCRKLGMQPAGEAVIDGKQYFCMKIKR